MAPEQLRAERATDRSDLWALAVVAGELAAGRHPFWQGEAVRPPADWDEDYGAASPCPAAGRQGFATLLNTPATTPAIVALPQPQHANCWGKYGRNWHSSGILAPAREQ